MNRPFFSIISKHKTILSYTLIWLITFATGCYFRFYPLKTYASSGSSEKASLLVIGNIRKSVAVAVERNFPNLPPLEKKKIIKEQFDNILRNEKDNVRDTIAKLSRNLDQGASPRRATPYLLASDSYYYYGLTEKILTTGKLSDKIKGSKYFNDLMAAPVGFWEPLNLHPYLGALIHRVRTLFKPDTDVMYSVSFVPIVLSALVIIPFLFICRALSYSRLITLVGALNLLLAPIYLKRSMFAWYDDDSYSLLFPLTIFALMFTAFNHRHSRGKMFLYAVAISLTLSLYALFWHGWVFLASVLGISGIGIILHHHFLLKRSSETPTLIGFFLALVLGSFVGVGIIFGPGDFFVLFQEGLTALKDFMGSALASWPDLYIAVGELRSVGPDFIIEMTGGIIPFCITLIGIVAQMYRLFKTPEKFSPGFIPAFVLFVFAFKMSLGAQRFTLLCLISSCIFFVAGLHDIVSALTTVLQKSIQRPKPLVIAGHLARTMLLALVVFSALAGAQHETPGLLNQIYNDTWDEALTQINKETPPDSIINTWWPPGHFIKATAKRRVTFDGATINKPQAYWLANVFLSQDERTALGLLRMLNNCANDAVDYLTSQGLSLANAVSLLKAIMPLSKSDAEKQLQGFLSPNIAAKLLAMTHQRPPPSYIMLYNELMEGALQLSFVGNWDFRKVEALQKQNEALNTLPRKGSKEYVPFLWQIAGGYPRISDVLGPTFREDSKILFDNGIQVDLETKDVFINSPTFGRGKPSSMFFLAEGQVVEKKFPDANLKFDLLLVPDENSFQALLMDDAIARSLVMRLYYFKGAGLKYFQPFSEVSDLTRRTKILVFKIDWEKFLQDIGEK